MANSVNSTLILNELMVGAAIKGKVNPYVQTGLKLVLVEEGAKHTLNGDDSQHALLIWLIPRIWAVVTPLVFCIGLRHIYFSTPRQIVVVSLACVFN